ncbi:uncharacterized protein BJX67DRAFT_375694 [Aspergillus lucknowensis]|uniref:Mis18 domain-containing protein n=1 Tax=Aspergillus lucknowensis TaxID=176173 RepID=A0ABR4L8S4_9EURO
MDLSKLTRPAVLCQCSRCSSSLAALENEWAKLSNSYSVAAGWLSIEPHRISISSEKKQIPQSSELSLIRGRIIQEIGCKLCQQKLGVLCALNNGANIFWKLSKVSFREIVTMRTVEPTFKDGDGVLESLLLPKMKEIGGAPVHHRSLIPAGSSEFDNSNTSVEHQIQQHGLSLDHISSSVNNLHDTMHELKQSFTAMRIELNGPSWPPNDTGDLTNGDFNMVTTMMKELKSKSEEIEKLKLELEALRYRNRYVEEQTIRHTLQPLAVQKVLPEVGTPGLLQRSKKRPFPFPEEYHSGRERPVADSFGDDDDDEDSMADFRLQETIIPPVKIPLRDRESTTEPVHDSTASRSPRLQIEVSHAAQTPPPLSLDEPVAKRPRLSSSGNVSANKKLRGRPRKSISQTVPPDLTQTSKPAPLNEQNGNAATNMHQEHPSSIPNDQRAPIENRPTRSRSLRRRSRPPSPNPKHRTSTGGSEKHTGNAQQDSLPELTVQPVVDMSKENARIETNGHRTGTGNGNDNERAEKRKAQSAVRDMMAKLAMQREEAMETEEAR